MQTSNQQLELTHKVHHCIQKRQWHQAKHYCLRLLKTDQTDAQVHHLLGLIHVQIAATCNSADLRREHEERAVSAFEAATLHAPEMAEAHINLGNSYLQVHRHEDGLKSYQVAETLVPESDQVQACLAEANRQLKEHTQALQHYSRAMALAPQKTSHLIKTGNFLRELGRHQDAIACYEQAIQLEPDHAEAYAQMAVPMSELGHTEAALGCCKIAIEIDPQQSVAHYHQAMLQMRSGNTTEALASLNILLEIQPQSSTAWLTKGLILMRENDFTNAIQAFDRAIEFGLNSFEVFQNRALCHKELTQLDKAIDDLETALDLNPSDAISLMTLGTISHNLKRHDAALNLYTQAIAQEPTRAEAYSNLGAVLYDLNRFDDAITTLKVATELNPNAIVAWNNLGSSYKQIHQFDCALAAFDRALDLDPKNIEALCYKGLTLQDQKQMDRSLCCYEEALRVDPENSLALWNRAFGWLLSGNFHEGWPAYESRWEHKKLNLSLREYPQPRWEGHHSIKGKRVLVYGEQGLGDTLQFARFVSVLQNQGAHVLFEVQPPLVGLLARCLPGVKVFPMGTRADAFDFHTPLLSLPGQLDVNEATIPFHSRYLEASSEKVAAWSDRLGQWSGPRIGLAWSGNSAHQNDRNRSIRLDQLISILPDGYNYACLQNTIRSEDAPTLVNHPRIHTYTEYIQDFEDTAALCHLMDIVISVDTSVAHLSAAMGKMTWTLIPFSPDWRWMLHREDTPWYDSMRLCRQEKAGDWQPVLKKLATDMLAMQPALRRANSENQGNNLAIPV